MLDFKVLGLEFKPCFTFVAFVTFATFIASVAFTLAIANIATSKTSFKD